MSTSTDDLIVRLAQGQGLLHEEQLAAAQRTVSHNADAPGPPPRLLDVLVNTGALNPGEIAQLLAEAFGLPVVDLSVEPAVPPDVLALVPRSLAVRHGLLPLAHERNRLRVAVSDPLATAGIDELATRFTGTIDVVVAPAADITRAIGSCYGAAAVALDLPAPEDGLHLQTGDPEPGPAPAVLDSASDGDAPIIRLVRGIIAEAVRRRASDIHWEPLERRFRVRYRVDGVLCEVENPPKRLQLAIVSRIKIMANLSIAEKRLPQDGRIALVVDHRPLDLRVSSLPTAHGESIVMRILDQQSLTLGLAELGFRRDDQTLFERQLALADGLVLVTGPTGSGKTTTLYAALQYLNRTDRKIITVEDPVEYQLSGINQVPVRPDAGVTFASALRAILRQAPNVVMIGEIRDRETADIAVNAALTGHLVFSTLHTNDAAGAVTRLVDLGVKPFLVSSALRAVLAQRLVRKTCETCRPPCVPPPAAVQMVRAGAAPVGGAAFPRGAGCPACLGSGYRGRTGIFELLVMNDELQRLVQAKTGSGRLRETARRLGMRTLREDGARKASAGLTTVEEVVSITVGDPG